MDAARPTAAGDDVALDELHRVEDGEPSIDRPARRIDVQRYVGSVVDICQQQQFPAYLVGCRVIYFLAEDEDPVLQQSAKYRVVPFGVCRWGGR